MIRLGFQVAVGVLSVDADFRECALAEGKTLVKHFGGDGGSDGGIFMVGIGCFGFGYLFGHLFAWNGVCLMQAGTQHAYLDGLLTDGVDEIGDEVGVKW